MKSVRRVKALNEIVRPYEFISPVDIQLSVNTDNIEIKKGERVSLTYPQYEALNHSAYAEFIN